MIDVLKILFSLTILCNDHKGVFGDLINGTYAPLNNIPVDHNNRSKLEIADSVVGTVSKNALSKWTGLEIASFVFRKNRAFVPLDGAHHQRPVIRFEAQFNGTEFTNIEMIDNDRLVFASTSVFAGMEQMRKLILNNNHIESLAAELFSDLSSLEVFEMEGNDVSSIERETFKFTRALVRINMARNHIRFLDEDLLPGLKQLNDLNLSRNNLDQIPESAFNRLNSLEQLDLSDNRISFVCPKLFRQILSNVAIVVQLRGNRFDEITRCLSENKGIIYDRKMVQIIGGNRTDCRQIFEFGCEATTAVEQDCHSKLSWGVPDCENPCQCGRRIRVPCDHVTGACATECAPGYFFDDLRNCRHSCQMELFCEANTTCLGDEGVCSEGCDEGYSGGLGQKCRFSHLGLSVSWPGMVMGILAILIAALGIIGIARHRGSRR